MAYNYNSNGNGDNNELISWLVVVGALVFFWPVGLFLLIRKLGGKDFMSNTNRQQQRSQHPYDVEQARKAGQGGAAAGQTPGAQESARQGAESGYSYKYEYRYQGSGGQSQSQAQSQWQSKSQSQSQRQGGWQPGAPGRKNDAKAAPGMQGVPQYGKPPKVSTGNAMRVWGGILTGIFGLATITAVPLLIMEGMWAFFGGAMPILGFLSLGIVLLASGAQRGKRAKRFRKYLALIGRRSSIAIGSLAQAMPVSYQTACDDLQEMLDRGYMPTGYLDMNSGRLILSDEGLHEEVPTVEEAAEDFAADLEEEDTLNSDALLDEIKQVNDAITDAEMSRKIDRIGEITAKILEYQRKNPGRAGQLRSFLNYYLPTTLKILRAYAQMEAQGIEGENIRSAKQRIEGMMDKVVEGFEKQLDKLFQDDAMDITTDVEVLERMLDKDGLSGAGDMFQMGG